MHHTTKHSSGAMPLKKKKKKRLRVKATGEGPKDLDVKKVVFMLSSQTVGNTWNTICVFLLLAKLRKQQREQIPLQKKLPLLDICAS